MEHDRWPHASERREADLDDAERAQRRHVRAKAQRMRGRLNDLALDLSLMPTVTTSGWPQILLTEVNRLHTAFALDPPDLDAVELALDRIGLFAEAMNSSSTRSGSRTRTRHGPTSRPRCSGSRSPRWPIC